MGQRMFVGIVPPLAVREELSDFLSARTHMTWIDSERWHVTLAFMDSVPVNREDELIQRLAAGFARKSPIELQLVGAGSFPDPSRTKVLWMNPEVLAGALEPLAVTARNAVVKAGIRVDGRKFVPHLSVARLRRSIEGTKWLQVLSTFASSPWQVDHVALVASHLREGPGGRPRYETVGEFPLGSSIQC